jgi:diguanylate cyclase (GGDEF)-like protein
MALSKIDSAWNGGWWDVAWTTAALAATVGTAAAAGVALPANRLRWKIWAAACAFWLFGQIGWNVFGVTGFPTSPNVADVCWWAFAVLVILSLIRSRSESRTVRLVTLVEVVPVVAAAISLSLAGLWHDAAISPLALAPKLSALIYPAVYVAAAVVMLQAMVSGSLRTNRTAPSRFVLAGMAAEAVAFSLWSTQLLLNTYVPGATLLDPLFVVGLLAIAAGGVLAARIPEDAVELHEPAKHGGALPATMFLLLLAANVEAQINHAATGPADALRIGLLCSGAALILRGTLLERRLREMLGREREALAVLGEREAEMARLNAQLAEDSRRDPLTGMRNRRALSDDLTGLEASSKEDGRRFILALCDIDHFKAYNDRLGHLAGDQALRVIAATIRGAMRPGDIAYRFGGEELLLVLRDLDEAEAVAAAERIRLAVRDAAIPHPDGIDGGVSITIGVAGGDGDSSELLARADAALYDGKHAGRNRVVVAASDAPSYAAGRRHRVVEEVVPRHLLSMLAVSREAASGHGEQSVLEALAATIRSELSFQVVSVNLLDSGRHTLTNKVVLGDDDCREKLFGIVAPSEEIEAVIANPEFQRLGAAWVPAGSHHWEGEEWLWTPHTAAVPGADGWDPDDFLLLPLRAHDGTILGTVSVDQPVSGRRPDDGQLALLMAVADHAGLAVEQSRRETEHSEAVQEQSTELRLAAVMLLAETLDLRDSGTARHSRTVGVLARQTAEALELPPERVEQIHAAGVLHDLGKLGIADAILYKAGPLDDHEWREIQRHPEIGARILDHAGLGTIAGWVRAHHERIDGHGYPDQLDREQIPLEARILAVADAYEAMTADRPYRAGTSTEAACEELMRCSGRQFDPVVVDAFINALALVDHAAPAFDDVPVSA